MQQGNYYLPMISEGQEKRGGLLQFLKGVNCYVERYTAGIFCFLDFSLHATFVIGQWRRFWIGVNPQSFLKYWQLNYRSVWIRFSVSNNFDHLWAYVGSSQREEGNIHRVAIAKYSVITSLGSESMMKWWHEMVYPWNDLFLHCWFFFSDLLDPIWDM